LPDDVIDTNRLDADSKARSVSSRDSELDVSRLMTADADDADEDKEEDEEEDAG
jgi:hypothetical protein